MYLIKLDCNSFNYKCRKDIEHRIFQTLFTVENYIIICSLTSVETHHNSMLKIKHEIDVYEFVKKLYCNLTSLVPLFNNNNNCCF